MRFLMLNWRDPRNPMSGGAERVSHAYLGALLERGHEVWWFANDFPGDAPTETVGGIKIVRGGGKGTSILRARQWYRQQQPFDLVIDQHHGIPWYAPWWAGTNSVAYIHEVLGPIWKVFYGWPLNIIGQRQERWTHWLYRKVPFWTPSESTKLALQRHGVREVKVFPNGTDAKPLAELEAKPLKGTVRLITVSRLAPNKRVDHALHITRILLQRGVQAHLTVVGTGESEVELKQMASQPELASFVTFTGQVSEAGKEAELRRAHLLIHTSVREGWGLNVIEANALGTPAIVYPVGGLVDSTVHNQTGIVTRDETPESVAEGVLGLLTKPAEYDRL
ncbi:MAG: glycosyltransferase family 4 protein, partial [Verrucomicrobia bacterium]|nr:glycosyltransferase family 4 protein [Verrucomicrobiota bacterium]